MAAQRDQRRAAVRADRRPAARHRPADRRPGRGRSSTATTTRSAARRSPGRSSPPATRRASRTPSAGSSGTACPGYVPREGLGPVEAIDGHPGRRRAPGPGPLPRGADATATSSRELVDAGLGGLEVHYRSFDRPTTDAVGDGRRGRSASSRPAAPTTTATSGRTPRRMPGCGSRRRSARRSCSSRRSAWLPSAASGCRRSVLDEGRVQLDGVALAAPSRRRLSASTKTLKPIAA